MTVRISATEAGHSFLSMAVTWAGSTGQPASAATGGLTAPPVAGAEDRVPPGVPAAAVVPAAPASPASLSTAHPLMRNLKYACVLVLTLRPGNPWCRALLLRLGHRCHGWLRLVAVLSPDDKGAGTGPGLTGLARCVRASGTVPYGRRPGCC